MKKILLLSVFILVFFASISFVCSAVVTENQTFGSGSNAIITTVTHNTPEHGKAINITAQLKYANGAPYADKSISYTLRARSDDSTQPEGQFSNVEKTDSAGRLNINWKGNPGWFDYYDFVICDRLDDFQRPSTSGNTYFSKTFDFTIKSNSTSITFDISKPTVYVGQYTEIKAHVTSNGNPIVTGQLLWVLPIGQNYTTLVSNGISILNYPGYLLGNNPIFVTFSGLDSTVFIPGYVVSEASVTKSLNIFVRGAPDLVIYKIARSGNKYKVTIHNAGDGPSDKTKFKLWYSSKKYKVITVNSLAAGASKTYNVNFFAYNTHKKLKKYAEINYDKVAYEKDYTNNRLIFKTDVAYGYCADLMISKITRKGNSYIVTIKNNGKVAASAFKFDLWFGSQTKRQGFITHTVSKFGQFGNKLPPGVSINLNVPYIAYKTHSKFYKFVQVNANKKIPESNYANNIKKFKI